MKKQLKKENQSEQAKQATKERVKIQSLLNFALCLQQMQPLSASQSDTRSLKFKEAIHSFHHLTFNYIQINVNMSIVLLKLTAAFVNKYTCSVCSAWNELSLNAQYLSCSRPLFAIQSINKFILQSDSLIYYIQVKQ
ncbi:hypothetical protein FGO68_gene3799 [Halteria grandinella]|uniref:Uncharacterized protein n=1 Tax=Halteria grandinella TaxID=5974 RepID=A0A8J8T9D0_HALGN|nr:hypothetical protein FGO68_gene3799 [Halteria grandinella]